jgi:hypothetical protein
MNETMRIMPWIICAITAAAFGWLAHRSKRGALLWSIGGGLLALVVSTIVLGLGNAVFIPISRQAEASFRIQIVALACLLVAILGWVLTFPLHSHHRPLREGVKRLFKKQ